MLPTVLSRSSPNPGSTACALKFSEQLNPNKPRREKRLFDSVEAPPATATFNPPGGVLRSNSIIKNVQAQRQLIQPQEAHFLLSTGGSVALIIYPTYPGQCWLGVAAGRTTWFR